MRLFFFLRSVELAIDGGEVVVVVVICGGTIEGAGASGGAAVPFATGFPPSGPGSELAGVGLMPNFSGSDTAGDLFMGDSSNLILEVL